MEDLQKVLEIVGAIGLDKFNGDSPLLFRAGCSSSPGWGPIVSLKDSKERCIEIIRKYYLGESDSSKRSSISRESFGE